ncbi:MAG: hypothetical protein QNJ77_08145 [Acidimicrobiia bacterium]|nr:hypothetical protein [Acidimicrobiia bacterium]
MRRIVIVAFVVALSAIACSTAGTETFAVTSEEGLVQAIADSNSDTLVSRFGEGSTACISQGIVDEFGIEGLAELGVTEETPDLQGGSVFFAPEAARQVVDVTIECIDLAAQLVSSLPKNVTLLNESLECVVDQLESETFRNLFADLVAAGGEPADIVTQVAAQLPMATLLLTCLSPEEILRVGDFLDSL